jgi:hypothetical protein
MTWAAAKSALEDRREACLCMTQKWPLVRSVILRCVGSGDWL